MPKVTRRKSRALLPDGVVERTILNGERVAAGTVMEVLAPEAMGRWIPEIKKPRPSVGSGGHGFKGSYTRDWMNKYIVPCMLASDSVNIVVRNGDRVLGYLTGGPLEKYSLYHPRAGLGDNFLIVGMETTPREGTGKGFGGMMAEKAMELARGGGYRFLAGFTRNPRLGHIYNTRGGLLKLDDRLNLRGWRNLTYVMDRDLIQQCRQTPEMLDELRRKELDTRPKRKFGLREEDEIIFGLRDKSGRALARAAQRIQNMLAREAGK